MEVVGNFRKAFRLAAQYCAVGFGAGSAIALQIAIARIFAVGSWAHFGSLVISVAMLGFGMSSVLIASAAERVVRHWKVIAGIAISMAAPAIAGATLVAQTVPFNAIFIASDPNQAWRLAYNFLLYLVPFILIALFLGVVFLARKEEFGKLYCADMVGAGAAGLLALASMYWIPPEHAVVVPMAMAGISSILFIAYVARIAALLAATSLFGCAVALHVLGPSLLHAPLLATSDYKGISYARRFPDARRIYRNISPYGDLQIYGSSYLHFAPGLSDNAAFNMHEIPRNAYLGMYFDGDGPVGIMRALMPSESAYFKYLPMDYPYLLKNDPDVFVLHFGGGISSMVALRNHSRTITIAEPNPAVLQAFGTDRLTEFTGELLQRPEVRVIRYAGRLYLKYSGRRYDVIDLSLADSTGLSDPGGFPIVEQYDYTVEAMSSYMRALRPGGILSITVWNKQEPPKSILKLYATVVEAARRLGNKDPAQSFFAIANYLSTTTVLYKADGFTAAEIALLKKHTRAMSFDEIYAPGLQFDDAQSAGVLTSYRDQVFGSRDAAADADGAVQSPMNAPSSGSSSHTRVDALPSTILERATWRALMKNQWSGFANQYIFDVRPLTIDRPYFAGYIRPMDLLVAFRSLDRFQDDWGYLVLWAALLVASAAATVLIVVPFLAGRRAVFSFSPGNSAALIYFACLGLGYIVTEVDLVGRFTFALGTPTIATPTVITAMLVFSGLGSLHAARAPALVRRLAFWLLLAITTLLLAYAYLLTDLLDRIAAYPLPIRIALSIILLGPAGFLMGFPMPIAMAALARASEPQMFVWAWGINGSFSVIGAVLVPIIAVQYGLAAALDLGAIAYLIAVPSLAVLFRGSVHTIDVMGGALGPPHQSSGP